MKVKVRVTPNSRQNLVETLEDGSLKVKLSAVPEKGKANKELIEVLSEHFKVQKSKVKILKGATSRDKLVEVDL